MEMNAGLRGFAAALTSNKAWVMNVVPTIAKDNTLGVIYERCLIGIYHDWYGCPSFIFHFCKTLIFVRIIFLVQF